MFVLLIILLLWLVGRLESRNLVKPHQLDDSTVLTATDRPKSGRNRCVIDVLVASLCCLAFHFLIT